MATDTSATVAADDQPLVVRLTRLRRTDADLRDAQAALQELYRRYAAGLLAFLAARVPQAALEDLHQTIWMRVWQHAPEQFQGGNFRAWLYRIARNAIVDLLRHKKFADDADLDNQADPQARSGLDWLLDEERRAALARCLERLDDRRREVVRGRLSGESYGELAERLGLPEARLYQLYHRAIADLRACVGEVNP
jgi:RNA polymerase sigma-70 factor (ECF subfamily)